MPESRAKAQIHTFANNEIITKSEIGQKMVSLLLHFNRQFFASADLSVSSSSK